VNGEAAGSISGIGVLKVVRNSAKPSSIGVPAEDLLIAAKVMSADMTLITAQLPNGCGFFNSADW
jgi:hypothetical protein